MLIFLVLIIKNVLFYLSHTVSYKGMNYRVPIWKIFNLITEYFRLCSFYLFHLLHLYKFSNVQHHFSICTDAKCAFGFGAGHRNALWHDSALEGVLGGGWGGLRWDSCEFEFVSPFISPFADRAFFSMGGSPRWFLFVGFRVVSWCAIGGALSTDWRLAARCNESRNGFLGGAGRVFVSCKL